MAFDCTVTDVWRTGAPTPRVYYKFRGIGNTNKVTTRQFKNVTEALKALYHRGAELGLPPDMLTDRFEIVRVDETPTAPRRELVTTGDLSLLNGPCVVRVGGGVWTQYLQGAKAGWVGTLDACTIFPNAQEARETASLRAIDQKTALRYDVIPVREVPGSVTTKETVLA